MASKITLHGFRKILKSLIVALLVAQAGAGAKAADFSSRPISIVVPFTPGGSNDVLARSLSQHLSRAMQATVVVENKPGAGGNIGAEYVARARPDGHTVLIAANTVMTVNPFMNPKQGLRPVQDLQPISLLGTVPIVLVVHPSVPVRNVRELIEFARANPEKLSYASSGTGTPQHLSAELFKSMTDTNLLHVPYKGAAPAISDLVAGQVQVLFGPINTLLPFIESGRLVALAVTGNERSSLLPTVPTVSEAGLPGYRSDIWIGLVGPAKLAPKIVERINVAVQDFVRNETEAANLAQQGIKLLGSSPQVFADLIEEDTLRWSKVIREAKLAGGPF